jgi:acyl carrier protein
MSKNLERGNQQMIETVRAVLADELRIPAETITSDQPIAGLPDLDSLRLLRVVTAIEQQVGVSVDDDLLYSATTVGDLADLFTGEGAATRSEPVDSA